MALKLRGGQKESSVRQAQNNRFKPTQPALSQPDQTQSTSTQIGQSFEKMGLGSIGGLGGRMGQLEQASMRLGQAASNRRMNEAGQEYELRGNLAQRESDISAGSAARLGGYSSVQDMSSSISRARKDAERKAKEAEDTARRLSQGQYQLGGRWFFGTGQR